MNRNLEKFISRRGQLVGLTTGSGMFYRYAQINGFDFIVIATASRFRQMGANSLSASMPYSNANELALDFALREIMSMSEHTVLPVFFGYCATDPTTDMSFFFDRLKSAGFAGICNIPTVLVMDGNYRKALEKAGFSYQREVEAIRLAHEKGLLTIAMAQDATQAKAMVRAGCDILCMHFGAARGGILGAKMELSLEKATIMANEAYAGALEERSDVILMLYGGPSKTPASIKFLMKHTKADGFIGGYSIEKIMYEEAMTGVSVQNILLSEGTAVNNKAKKNLIEASKEYIEKNYPGEVNIQELAEEMHVSRSYLSHRFHREVGISFRDYLIRYRMERACHLLKSSEMSICDIAQAIGYSDLPHFSKLFKKKMGVSPSVFRKEAQKDKIKA